MLKFRSTFRKVYRTLTNTREFLNVEVCGAKKNVAVLTLNRPKALNALCSPLMKDVNDAIRECDNDKSIGCMILTGSKKAFAAGADIEEMLNTTFSNNWYDRFLGEWSDVAFRRKKPLIAVVRGWALGGGCELAMMCDIIYAGESAKFGQPEIKIGTIPGAGGTQRLTRVVGKSLTMEMVMTGEPINAETALKTGLVSKVYNDDDVINKAIETAEKISSMSKVSISMCREAVNAAYNTNLNQGLALEHRFFHATFALKDRKEGMAAFLEKRPPNFTDE